MTDKILQFKQQGDVTLFRKDITIPATAKEVTGDPRGHVLAEGEVTGHYHGIEELSDAKLYQDGERMLLEVFSPTELKHQEHDAFVIEPGIWEIGIVQEYDHFAEEAHRVAD